MTLLSPQCRCHYSYMHNILSYSIWLSTGMSCLDHELLERGVWLLSETLWSRSTSACESFWWDQCGVFGVQVKTEVNVGIVHPALPATKTQKTFSALRLNVEVFEVTKLLSSLGLVQWAEVLNTPGMQGVAIDWISLSMFSPQVWDPC